MSFDEFGDGNDLLMGGEKVKSCSFRGDPGIVWEGVVLEGPKAVQQRDYEDETILLWWDQEKTKPKLSLVIKLQTTVIDPNIPDDTGVRALWLKGNSQKAVVAAVRAAGANGIMPGGYLVLDYYAAVDTPPKPGENPNKVRYPTKMYRATYTPPPSAGNQALMNSYQEPTHQDMAAAAARPSGGIGDVRAAAAAQSAVLAQLRQGNQNAQGQLQGQEPPF